MNKTDVSQVILISFPETHQESTGIKQFWQFPGGFSLVPVDSWRFMIGSWSVLVVSSFIKRRIKTIQIDRNLFFYKNMGSYHVVVTKIIFLRKILRKEK